MFLVFLSNLSVGVLINFVLIKKKKCIPKVNISRFVEKNLTEKKIE